MGSQTFGLEVKVTAERILHGGAVYQGMSGERTLCCLGGGRQSLVTVAARGCDVLSVCLS